MIEAIFTVCDRPHIEVRQCPLSLEKWDELVVGTIQSHNTQLNHQCINKHDEQSDDERIDRHNDEWNN
jgi:hypothetical protein